LVDINILICTQSFPRFEGDINAPFLLNLAIHLNKHSNVTVISPHDATSEVKDEWGGLAIHRFEYARPKREILAYTGSMHKVVIKPWNWLLTRSFITKAKRSIQRLSRDIDAGILYAHWILPTGYLAVKSRKNEKVVIHVHGTDFTLMQKSRTLKKFSISTLKRADGIICVSQQQAETIEKFVECPIMVQSMGIDLSRFNFSAKNEFNKRVLFVGRVTEAKGVNGILAAAKLLPDWHFTIVGDGPYLPELKLKSGNVANMLLVGKIANDELPKYYHEADVFLLPSQREGVPVTIVEALACGVPVIATDVGQISELVKDGENGYLIDGSPESIVASLVKLPRDSTWRAFSKAGPPSVAGRGVQQTAENIIEFMELL
jgi:glycosyltransferase involved in cell wall biosynthesis